MGARDAHIAKYLTPYQQSLYPTSPILLIRNEVSSFMRPSLAINSLKAHAVPVIREVFTASNTHGDGGQGGDKPELLIHVFSNGGSASLAHLRTLLSGALPPHVTVFDSTPGLFTYTSSIAALTAGLKGITRLAVLPVFHLLAAWYLFLETVLQPIGLWEGPLTRYAKVHNERDGRAAAELRRAYVYSEGDELVGWKAVEGHALEATRRGFVVRMEKFEGSAHVSHVRVDEGKYWGVVRKTWEGW